MAKLKDLFTHHDDFTPSTPKSEGDICKCPECGKSASFAEWKHHDGIDSGFWCDSCYDLHSCFECPHCGEYFGAAGMHSKSIEVEVQTAGHDHECLPASEVAALPDTPKPNTSVIWDAVRDIGGRVDE